MGCLGFIMHRTLDFCPRPASKETNVPLHNRSSELIVLIYILCAARSSKKRVVTHLCSVACICGSNEGFVKLRTLGRWTQKQIESIFTLCKSTSFSTKTTNSKMFPQILPFLKFQMDSLKETVSRLEEMISISQSFSLAF